MFLFEQNGTSKPIIHGGISNVNNQPIHNISDVCALIQYDQDLGQHRNHPLIVFGLHTALCISDMLKIRWRDVYDFSNKCVRKTFTQIPARQLPARKPVVQIGQQAKPLIYRSKYAVILCGKPLDTTLGVTEYPLPYL